MTGVIIFLGVMLILVVSEIMYRFLDNIDDDE